MPLGHSARGSRFGGSAVASDPYSIGTTPAPIEPDLYAGAVADIGGGGGSNAGVVDTPGVTTMATPTTANKVWVPWGGETMGGYWADAPAAQAQPDTGMDLSSVFGAYNIPISIGNSDAQTLYRALAIDNAQGNNNAVNTLAQTFGVDPASVMSDTALWNTPQMNDYAAKRVEIGNQENMMADLLQGAAWVGGGALGINSLLNPSGISGLFGDLAGTQAAAPVVDATITPVSQTGLLSPGDAARALSMDSAFFDVPAEVLGNAAGYSPLTGLPVANYAPVADAVINPVQMPVTAPITPPASTGVPAEQAPAPVTTATPTPVTAAPLDFGAQLSEWVQKNPLQAAQLGIGAAGLLNQATQPADEPYQPPNIDQSIVSRYGAIPSGTVQTGGAPSYQDFQTLNGSAGLQSRLNKIRGIL